MSGGWKKKTSLRFPCKYLYGCLGFRLNGSGDFNLTSCSTCDTANVLLFIFLLVLFFYFLKTLLISQGLQTTPTVGARLVSGAAGLDPPFSALQAPKGPVLELLHRANVNRVRGEPSAQIREQQGGPMWRGSPAGPPINAQLVSSSTRFILLACCIKICMW